MCHHGAALLRRKLRRIVEDVSERLVELADVVKERNSLDAPEHPLVVSSGFAEYQRVGGDTADVGAGDGIVSVDRIKQCLQSCGAHTLGSRPQAALAIRESTSCSPYR